MFKCFDRVDNKSHYRLWDQSIIIRNKKTTLPPHTVRVSEQVLTVYDSRP